MAVKLYYHPLSSFSWKALIAAYELGVSFDGVIVDEATRAELVKLWPLGKFPTLVDGDKVVPESTPVIEHLDRVSRRLAPRDQDLAREVRLWDRFFDLHIHDPMQRIVADRLRPPEAKYPLGVAEARERIATAYGIAEARMAKRHWAVGDDFSLADCAAAPALFYGNKVQPFGPEHPALTAYLARLSARPSFARVLKEAEPYFQFFPTE